MKKMIYPLSYECREMIRYYDLREAQDDYIFVVKDNTDSYYTKYIEKLEISNIHISSDFDTSIELVDDIILVDGSDVDDFVEKIQKAKSKNIRIHATYSVRELLKTNGELDEIIPFEEERDLMEVEFNELLNIDVPVIAIAGLGSYCDKFINELYFRQYYISRGYKVLQFGSKEFSGFFGVDSMPEYISNNSIPICKRILSLNHYISTKVEKEKPDIIIIGVAEGIMPLSNSLLNNFGETMFVLSNAISIDYTIMGVYYNEKISKDFVHYLDKIIEYKFNSELLAICVSNTFYEPTPESFGELVKYYHLDMQDDFEGKFDIDYPINGYNIYSEVDQKEIAEKTIRLLTENIEVLM